MAQPIPESLAHLIALNVEELASMARGNSFAILQESLTKITAIFAEDDINLNSNCGIEADTQ
jgi:hypothetical protein